MGSLRQLRAGVRRRGRIRVRSRTCAFGPRVVRYPSSTLKCGDPRSRTLGAWDPESRYGCRRSKARSRNAARSCWVPDDFVGRPWRQRYDLAKSAERPIEKAPPGRGLSRDETWGSSETHGSDSAANGVGIRTIPACVGKRTDGPAELH